MTGVVVVTVGGVVQRHRVARRLAVAAARLEPDRSGLPDAGLSTQLDRLDQAVDRVERRAALESAGLRDLHAALDALPLGVVVADAEGRVRSRNLAAAAFVHVHHADVLVEEAVHQQVLTALRDGESRRTLELYGPPRRTLVVQAVRIDGGAGAAAVATVEDVTDRVRLEAARTDFVANLSHELKTPVGGLALLAEALAGEEEPDLVERLAQMMVSEAHRVARIIDDLLELSRIELDSHTLHEPVAVSLVLGEAVERVRHLADSRSVKILVEEADQPLVIVGDRRQLVSAVGNLVENAVKYSDEGGEVRVAARAVDDHVDIDVVDQGIGIPARDLDRIFERFYRVDRARSRETGGTGLGLAIVRHVATNHAGSVSVRSQEGAGSTFTLTLPAGTAAAPARAELRAAG